MGTSVEAVPKDRGTPGYRVQPSTASRRRSGPGSLRDHWPLYLMAMPGIVSILVFGYGPLFGLVIAFLDYSPVRGVRDSEWVGLDNFRTAFDNPFFMSALWNSLIISSLKLTIGFPSAIVLALLLNEVRVRWFKGVIQTATILPFFVSWVVVGTMFRSLFAPDGVINEVRQVFLGIDQLIFLSDPEIFRWIIVFQDTWKAAGYFAVLYLAAMTAIDPVLYEAAEVDGASRWRQTLDITLPGIRTTMVTLFVLLSGYLIFAGWEQIIVMYNPSVYSTADVLETFSLRLALSQGQYGLATAVGLFQSVIGLGLVLITNWLARRYSEQGGLF
ncbi:MAG: ABC transporter, permease protein 1 (cluster 1, maltose/g3p/polyamine/iron) [uncultured Thermomicrobiales bacterium]|uniref:ABC transporter, permease protein 1 (Cluster 1, maltose/g3p/polyamine/iron) n=1 Tax=uncultured Thermomicrobiales bacterium TaxID=1645740 RepID=A0A6J4VJK7_9BACT|nr:MAG: ABC transporter, permease protein 1 (cluster 1, maltose/g3p/polyamine/iron) [uncultured Thermomicrobiales bacterium]